MTGAVPRVLPFNARKLDDGSDLEYDSMLASVGFETRSRQIAEAVPVVGKAIPFKDHQVLDYDENLKFFKRAGWDLPEVSDEEYFVWVSEWLTTVIDANQPARIAIDVSSMSRRRIADVIEAIVSLPEESELEVDFLYTAAKFEKPDKEKEPPIFSVAPVSEFFAGWWDDLEKPLFAIVGLGYELERAASALDRLEPSKSQLFVPEGRDSKYLKAVREANLGLYDWRGLDPEEVLYPVSDPFACFRQLEQRVSRLQSRERIALVPLGPKIFAVAATLTAALHPVSSQVIRVTAGLHQPTQYRPSDGSLFGLTVVVRPLPDPGP
jgi:hypothetical protein